MLGILYSGSLLRYQRDARIDYFNYWRQLNLLCAKQIKESLAKIETKERTFQSLPITERKGKHLNATCPSAATKGKKRVSTIWIVSQINETNKHIIQKTSFLSVDWTGILHVLIHDDSLYKYVWFSPMSEHLHMLSPMVKRAKWNWVLWWQYSDFYGAL